MNQDPERRLEHILDRITVCAPEPQFIHPDIARLYQDGACSRLDAELADILRDSDAGGVQWSNKVTLIPLSGEGASPLGSLNCIALIQDGQALPLLDIEQMPLAPLTQAQKIHLYYGAVRILLDAVAAILEERAERKRNQQLGDDDEGVGAYV